MDKLIQLLDIIKTKIGYEAVVFVVLAFIVVLFAGQLGQDSGTMKAAFQIAAGVLLAIGVLIGLLRMFSVFFTQRPARGLVDGLAAGLLAGLIGGYFGYGFHEGPGYASDSPQFRVLLCTVFSVPIGGVLGLCFDLVHPDRPVAWRRYLGAILLSLALLFLLVSFAVVVLAPKIEGIGIVVSDIQLLFELFLLASAALASFSFAWSRRRWLTQSCILFLSIVSARALTFFVPFESICQPQTRRLSEMMFFAREARCIEQPEWMAVALVLLMLWALGTYALYFKLHLVRTVELDLEDG